MPFSRKFPFPKINPLCSRVCICPFTTDIVKFIRAKDDSVDEHGDELPKQELFGPGNPKHNYSQTMVRTELAISS